MSQSKYDEKHRDIATHYQRAEQEPLEVRKQGGTGNPAVPDKICFFLPGDSDAIEAKVEGTMVIGRQPRPSDPAVAVDLAPHEGHRYGVSRCHAMISVVNGTLMVQDLHSMNGTLLNDKRLEPLRRYPLYSGDRLTVGTLTMHLLFVHHVSPDDTPERGESRTG